MDIQDEKLMNVMFGRINDKLDSNFKLLHKDMEYVKKQTSKTNGTVADVVNRLVGIFLLEIVMGGLIVATKFI
jgi:hypothetical protein